MTDRTNPHRRTVLKTLGASVIGATTLAGTAGAGDTGDERRNDTFTWAHDVVYEMQVAEPVVEDPETGELLNPDSEGVHEGMEPIYIVAPQNDEHSPHDTFGGFTFDHIIDLEPGKQFYSAQWHTHYVADPPVTENRFVLAETGFEGAPLTSESAVLEAADEEVVTIVPAYTESGEPGGFTCPVRPHQHK